MARWGEMGGEPAIQGKVDTDHGRNGDLCRRWGEPNTAEGLSIKTLRF